MKRHPQTTMHNHVRKMLAFDGRFTAEHAGEVLRVDVQHDDW